MANEAILFEHDDGRYAVGVGSPAFTHDNPAWHRVGPVDVSALTAPVATEQAQAMAALIERWTTAGANPSGDDRYMQGFRDCMLSAARELSALPVHDWPTRDSDYSEGYRDGHAKGLLEGRESGYTVGRLGGIGRPDMHPATAELVTRFGDALRDKLAAAEKKYGYSDGWLSLDWMDECRKKLIDHVAKGDPRDVAAYCAFLWHHGEKTFVPTKADPYEALMNEVMACGGEVTPREIIFNHATFDVFMQSRKGKTALDFFADDVESSLAASPEAAPAAMVADEQIIRAAYQHLSTWDEDHIRFARAVLALAQPAPVQAGAQQAVAEVKKCPACDMPDGRVAPCCEECPQHDHAPATDEMLGAIAYKGFDDYWTEHCAGRDSEAWAASAKAVLAFAATAKATEGPAP